MILEMPAKHMPSRSDPVTTKKWYPNIIFGHTLASQCRPYVLSERSAAFLSQEMWKQRQDHCLKLGSYKSFFTTSSCGLFADSCAFIFFFLFQKPAGGCLFLGWPGGWVHVLGVAGWMSPRHGGDRVDVWSHSLVHRHSVKIQWDWHFEKPDKVIWPVDCRTLHVCTKFHKSTHTFVQSHRVCVWKTT